MNSKWRPTDWSELKGTIRIDEPNLKELADKMMEYAATQILEAYSNSDEFGEDASEYCRCQGWEEPR